MHFLIEEIELFPFHSSTSPHVPGKSTFWTFYVLTLFAGPDEENTDFIGPSISLVCVLLTPICMLSVVFIR